MRERRIFQKAIELQDSQKRAEYLQRECGDDGALLARVERLLESFRQMGGFLAKPVLESDSSEMGQGSDRRTMATTVQTNHASDVHSTPGESDKDRNDEEAIPTETNALASLRPYLSPSDTPGSLGRLLHYDVYGVQGQGAFGIVLQGKDTKLQRLVAIKVLLPSLANTSPPRKRFLREALAAASIRHENVVSVYSVDEEPIPFLTMEFIGGQNLQERVDDSGPLELKEVLSIGRQLFAGLEAAHTAGIIHRDIKPSNILVEDGGRLRIKITDFGLARTVDDAKLTQTGYISGTPMYMSPEQAQGSALDTRSDLFGIGSVLYLMLTGRPPFRAPTSLAVLKRVVEDTPRPIEQIVPETPEWIRGIVCKLHAKSRFDRFESATEVRELWEACEARWTRGEPITDELRKQWALPSESKADNQQVDARNAATNQASSNKSFIALTAMLVALAAIVCIPFVLQSFMAKNEANKIADNSKDALASVAENSNSPKDESKGVGQSEREAGGLDVDKRERSAPRMNARVTSSTNYRMIRGATRAELMVWAEELHAEFIPHSINPRYGTDPTLIDAIAIPNESKSLWQLHDVVDSEADFQSMWHSHRPAWRMQILDGSGNLPRTMFLWVADIPFWRVFMNHREGIHTQANILSVEKFFPSSLFGLRINDHESWTLTQAPMPEYEFRSFPDMDSSQLDLEMDLFRGRDWIPSRMMQHVGFSEPRFAVVFRQNPGKIQWEYAPSVREEDWDRVAKEYESKKMFPAIVSSEVKQGQVTYRVMWSSKIESK